MKTSQMPKRRRVQLCVALGEGETGQERRALLERAARASGKSLSVWARLVLGKAVGLPNDGVVGRDEFEALAERVRRLEWR